MKKFLFFLIICGVILYFLADDDSGHDAQYNATTYELSDTIDPFSEEAYQMYHYDGTDE